MDPNRPEPGFWLVGINGNTRRVRLSADSPLLVGRGAHNHLILNDYRISRQHSRVTRERDGFVVYDLNSSNGTFVNGVAIRRQEIKPNDELSFGPHAFRVEWVGETSIMRSPGEAPSANWQVAESMTSFYQVNTRKAPDPQMETIMPPGDDHFATTDEVASLRLQRPPNTGPLEAISMDDDDGSEMRESSRYRAEAVKVDLFQLEDAYQKLTTLYAFMQAISKTIDRNELQELIARGILNVYPAATDVGIYMRDDRGRFTLVHFASDTQQRAASVLPSETVRALLHTQKSIFDAHQTATTTSGTSMFAPMVATDDVFGVIYVAMSPRSRTKFTLSDLELLDGVAVPAAITLQNTRMHEESLLRERLNRDLELAAQMQKSFLPREVPSVEGVEFLATYQAAYTVGGDFYDVFWVGPHHLAVFIGDIAGKGIAAALLMARITGELRVAALAHVEPVPVLTVMNRSVIDRGQPEVFFTAIYFTLDVRTGEVRLAAAGQPPPYVCHADGTVDVITDGGNPAVGMLEDTQFTATRLFLREGDSLVLYTDGVVEAATVDGALYGDDRLAHCLSGTGSRPQDISDGILRDVGAFVRSAQPNDDMTIFICHRQSGHLPTDRSFRRHAEEAPMTPRMVVTARR